MTIVALTIAAFAPTEAYPLSGIVNAPPTVIGDNQTLDSNSTLTVNNGGVVGLAFRAGSSTLPNSNHNILVNIKGGTVGEFLYAGSASTINISGGSVAANLRPLSGSIVNISGGSVGSSLRAESGSTVNISGGTIAGSLIGDVGSHWNINGGVLGQPFIARTVNMVTLSGGEYLLNGTPAPASPITLGASDVLTGTFQDGTPFVFSPLQTNEQLNGATLVTTSLPAASTVPITVSPGTSSLKGLRAGQKLTLAGGTLNNDFALVGATLNINSGTVGYGTEVVGSTVNITGGTVGAVFSAYTGSTVNISEGSIGQRFSAFAGSQVNITGGILDFNFKAETGSTLNVSGGGFADLNAKAGSAVTLRGGEFLVNGAVPTSPVTLSTFDVFTGTLADGSVFIIPKLSSSVEFSGVTLASQALPPLDLTPKTISTNSTLQGLRAGQSLTVNPGGAMRDHFNTVGATMKVTGGTVGRGMKAVNTSVAVSGGTVGDSVSFYSNSTLTVTGGSIGESTAVYNSTANISGGTIGEYFTPIYSTITVNGGSIGDNFTPSFSTVNFRGGTTGTRTLVSNGSVFNLSGGTLGSLFTMNPGTTLNIYGTQFILGPSDITNTLTLNTPYTITNRSTILNGSYADGSPFHVDLYNGAISSSAQVNVILVLSGDFNFDGAVDGADYVVWRKGLGTTYTVNEYNIWRSHLGQPAAGGESLVAVPEPEVLVYGFAATMIAAVFKRNNVSRRALKRGQGSAEMLLSRKLGLLS